MSTAKFIGDHPDDIKRLATEVADLKSVLEGMLQQVRRVERRIDLALPEGAKVKRGKTGNGVTKSAALNASQARQIIDRLTEELRDKNPVQTELRSMTMKYQLQPIARELGIADAPPPAKMELIARIMTRLRQRIMLTENVRKISHVAEEKERFGN